MGLGRLGLITSLFFTISCSQKASPPELAPRPQRMPVEECYKADLDLRQLKVDSVKNFLYCLNGRESAIQPYVDFLEQSLSDNDLKVILEIYNKHLVSESRFRKVFDLIDLHNKKNISADYYENLSHLTETRSIQTILPLLSILYQLNDEEVRGIDSINKYLRTLISNEELNSLLLSLARFAGSGKFKFLLKTLKEKSDSMPFALDFIVDELSESIYGAIQNNELQNLLIKLSQPKVYASIREATHTDMLLAKQAGLLEFLFKKNDKISFKQVQKLARATNKKLYCWDDAYAVDSLLDSVLRDISIISSEDSIERFLGQEIPQILYLAKDSCGLQSDVIDSSSVLLDIVKSGQAVAMQQMLAALNEQGLNANLVDLITSSNIKGLTYLLSNLSVTSGFYRLFEIIKKDWDEIDYKNFQSLVLNLYLVNLPPEDLEVWLFKADINDNLKAYLMSLVQIKYLDLFSLVEELSVKKSDSIYYFQFIDYLSSVEMNGAAGKDVENFLLKLFGPNFTYRNNLKDAARAAVNSIDDRYGWADLLGSIGETISLVKEEPLIEFFADLINDEEFVKAVNPVLEKFFDDPFFLRSLAFTGELAKNGELRRLINFFVQISKSIDVPGLDTSPSNYNFKKFRGDPSVFNKVYDYWPKENTNFESCRELSLSGANFKDFMSCSNINEQYGGWNNFLVHIEDIDYQDGDLLQKFSVYISNIILDASTPRLIIALKESKNLGYFNGIVEELSKFLSSRQLFDYLEDILSAYLNSPYVDIFFDNLSQALLENKLSNSLSNWLELLNVVKDPYVSSYPNFISPVPNAEALYQRAYSWRRGLDYSEVDGSTIEDLWNLKYYHYIHRNQNYLYDSNIYEYPGLNLEEKKEYYLQKTKELLGLVLRPGNIEAILLSIKELNEDNFSFIEFLDWAQGGTDVIKYWYGTNVNPSIRIVTNMDKLELLVQNAQISVARWAGSLGARHIATLFQYEIATSSDLPDTINALRSRINQAINYQRVFGGRRKLNNLQNIRETFSVLEDMVDQNHIDFLYKIYRSLLDVTPDEHKERQDPILNHMGLAHYPSSMAFFARSVQPLQSVVKQDKLGEFYYIISSLFSNLNSNEVQAIRDIVYSLSENNELLETLIENLIYISNDSNTSKIFYQNIVNTILGLSKINGNWLDLLQTIRLSLPSKTFSANMLEFIFNELVLEENKIINMINALNYHENKSGFKPLANTILNYGLLPSFVYNLLQIYDDSEDLIRSLISEYKLVCESISDDWHIDLIEHLSIDNGYTFIALSNAINSEEKRGLVLRLLKEISLSKSSHALSYEFLAFLQSSDIDNLLRYTEHLKPTNR